MKTTEVIAQPDLSSRPLKVVINKIINASPSEVFEAWTSEKFANWFAAPGTVIMKPEINSPFFFESHYEGQRHPHYGRFLRLEPDHFIQLTWLTEAGTRGAETVVTIELTPVEKGTEVSLVHTGFLDENSRKDHEDGWSHALGELNDKIH